MRHLKKGKTLDRNSEARSMMLRNMASSIIIYEKIKTTSAKAEAVRSMVEKAITLAKEKSLSSRRQLISLLPQKMAVKKIIEVIAGRYADKKGGYTKITKLARRIGDGAEEVIIELV